MRFTFCLILPSLIFTEANALNTAQPISIFNSNNIDEEKAYVKDAAVASTVSSHIQIGNNKNIGLASFLISANESTNLNLIPVLLGSIKISWNLALTGRMSAFSKENKAINIYGWGISYKPGKEDKISPWVFRANSGIYRSFNMIRSSSFSLSLSRNISLKNFDILLGFSSNNVKGINYKDSLNIVSQNFEYNFNTIIFGTTVDFMDIKLLPSINYNSNIFTILIGLQKEF